jgi:acetyltransferase-like isoleucine patch superfamily enzyme
MNLLRHFAILLRNRKTRAARWILAHRVQYHNPSLDSDPTAIWDYGYSDLDAIEIGKNVVVRAFAEILVFKRTRFSSTEGRLILGDGVVISTGANVRAAGGTIRIGDRSVVSQHSILVAANHGITPGVPYLNRQWDETRTGIDIGSNVWIGAACVVLPGATIGDNSVVAAGSVVTKSIPPNEIWGGVPAKKLKSLETDSVPA